MIFVFGAILQLIRVETDQSQRYEQFEFTKFYKNSVGGKAALQAVAAAKAGAKTAIVSKTGDDELSKHILLRLRKHGVITSAVAKTEKTQTGTAIRLEHENRTIIALGASERTGADQLPKEVLSERNIILAQTELNGVENNKLLKKAKAAGATTILNASPRFEIRPDTLEHIDYLITGAHQKENWKAISASSSIDHLTTIFIAPDGNVELHKNGQSSSLPKVRSEEIDWSSPEGYEDTFCGTFAAGLSQGQELDIALLRAQIASALTASKPGAYDAIPYVDSIDEYLKSQET